MEILFWLAPLFETFCFLLGMICILSVCGLIILIAAKCGESNKVTIKHIKQACVFIVVSFLFCGAFSIFSDPMNTYKKILIYRGINSTLADKTINTAEKALNILSKKLDEQLLPPKAEMK